MKKIICILAIVISFTSCSIYPSGYETIDKTGDMYRHWDPIYYGYYDPFFFRPRSYYFYAPRPIVIERPKSNDYKPREYVLPRSSSPFVAPKSSAPIRSFPRKDNR